MHNKTPTEVEQAVLDMRLRHPSWGPKKLLHKLTQRQPRLVLPGRSTIADILTRNGRITQRPRRRTIGHPANPGDKSFSPTIAGAPTSKDNSEPAMVCIATR